MLARHPYILAMVVLLGACDSDHAARPDLDSFLDALEFGDVDRLFELHVDSTTFSTWCTAEFRAIIEKAQKRRDDEECARLGEIGASDLDAMADELRLAVQVAAFACQQPRGTCTEYGERVFRQAVAERGITARRPASHKVRRLFGDESKAAAYVELTFADGATEQRILEMRRLGNRWRVDKGLLR